MKKLFAIIPSAALILSLAACGASQEPAAKSVDLNAIYEGYADILPEMMVLDETTMLNFLGINAEDCARYKVAICSEGMRADEVWLIEAKDAASLEKLQQLAQTRIEAKLDETISYVPDQYVIVEKAEVLVNGMYLALLISPDVDALKAGFEAAFQ